MKTLRTLLAFLLLSASAFATTTVSGKVQNLGTGNITSNTFVRFWLRGCAGNQPRITGTAIIGPSQGGVFFFDIAADGSGNLSGTIYSTRDSTGLLAGDIECGGSKTAVWYGIQMYVNGKGGPEIPVHALNGATLDPSTITPITTNPVVTAPNGDSIYARLDGGNQPFTGNVTPGSDLTLSLGNSTHRWNASLGVTTATLGTFSKTDATQVYTLRVLDPLGTRGAQLIGLNIEQMLNPPSTASYFNFGQATELFTASANSQIFPSAQQEAAVYGSFSHFGSGSLYSGYGGSFEGFNDGPATATLIVGVGADATNGGVAAGNPVQFPTNNGNATNLRAFDAFVRNLSSGVAANAAALYVEAASNTGGGSITNNYGLNIQDQTAGTNNWAIRTGAGKVEFNDTLTQNGVAQFNKQVGVGVNPPAGIGVALQPNGFTLGTGTSQTGLYVFPATNSFATSVGIGIQTRADVANSTTQATNIGLDVVAPSIGSGGSIGTWNGIRIEAPPAVTSTACSMLVAGTSGGSTCINAPATGGGNNTLPSISGSIPVIVAHGTAVMTTAGILAGACGSTVSVSAPNVTTTDAITWSFNGASAGSNAGLQSWPTGGNVNFAYCPNSAETPAAATINWFVSRS